jgi:hypothetical protein
VTTQWVQEGARAEGRELVGGNRDGSHCYRDKANQHESYAERRHAVVRSTSR